MPRHTGILFLLKCLVLTAQARRAAAHRARWRKIRAWGLWWRARERSSQWQKEWEEEYQVNLAAQKDALAVWASRVGSCDKIYADWLALSEVACRCDRQSARFDALREWRCSGIEERRPTSVRRQSTNALMSNDGWSRGDVATASKRGLAQKNLFLGQGVNFLGTAMTGSTTTMAADEVKPLVHSDAGPPRHGRGGDDDEWLRLLEEEIFRHSERDMQRLEHLTRSKLLQNGHGRELENGHNGSHAPSSSKRDVSFSSRLFRDESLAGGCAASTSRQDHGPVPGFSSANGLLRSPDVRGAPWDGMELLGTPT